MYTPTLSDSLTRKDFISPADVRWCPGCGDYAILNSVQNVVPELGIPKEKFVFISGIGCSSRFPYYMNTYGFHTIHGRAPAIATGVKVANPELSVWVMTGDGDGLSIGGNHLVHTLRRNVDINIILFNNKIYGLTKGQYSPTSPQGQVTKTSPYGTLEHAINPISMAIASQATFVARTIDTSPKHMKEIFKQAALHKGVSFVEVFQNCVIFNNNAWREVSGRDVRDERLLFLEHGKPLKFGASATKGLRQNGASLQVVKIGEHGSTEDDVIIHDAAREDSSYAYSLAQLAYPEYPIPVGIFRDVDHDSYDSLVEKQIDAAVSIDGRRNLQRLLKGDEYWEVSDSGKKLTMKLGNVSEFEEENKIMEERDKALLKLIKDPLSAALRFKIGDVYHEVGHKRALTISVNESLAKAISLLKSRKVDSLLVAFRDKIVGLLTERDIVMNVVLSGMDRDTTKVSHVMRPSFDLISEDNTVGDAINVIALSGGRHIPIKLHSGEYGIVNTRQILWFIHAKLAEEEVK